MLPEARQTIPLRSSEDIVLVRQTVRKIMMAQGFGLVDQTKMVTAASELARNVVVHGGGGSASIVTVADGRRTGIRLTFEDQGKGIADIAQAMQDGFSTNNGLGFGLGGAKRLVNEFHIESRPGKGTQVIIARWK